MTIKEKRIYLNRYQHIQNRIFGLTNELEKWKAIGEKVNNAIGAGAGSGHGNNSKVEKSAVNTTEILKEIQAEIDKAEEERQLIIAAINHAAKLRHREILKMYFVHGMSVEKIAHRLKKEEKTVSNAITNALRDLEI